MTNISIQQGKVRINELKRPRFNSDYRETVKFATPFKSTPSILMSITHLDTTSFVRTFPYEVEGGAEGKTEFKDTVLRYDCTVEDPSNTEFTIHVKTWAHNIIYAVDVAWIAIGEPAQMPE